MAPSIFRDIRHTVRSLWREKAFSGAVLATFALCLSANVVIFTVVHSILLAPLPFEDPEQLVIPDNNYTKVGLAHIGASVPNYFEWKEDVPAFAETGAFEVKDGLIGAAGSPERVKTVYATPGFFRVLAVKMQLGRVFREEEGSYGGKTPWNVAVISDSFWRQRFGADPGILGKAIPFEGGERFVVGVLPPGFRFLSTEAPLWVTMVFTAGDRNPARRHWNSTNVIARLRPGSTIGQAQAQVDALNARLAKDDPGAGWAKGAGFKSTVRGLHAAHVEQVRPALLLLQGGVLLLLFVGIVNVLNLLMVRATGRAKEISVRKVLGASRLNIITRLLTETSVLTGMGTLIGLSLAAVALKFIDKLGVDQLPLGAVVHLDRSVVLVAAGSAVLLALVLAIPLVVFASGTELASVLASESRSGTTSRGTHRLRHSLIVAQIALAFVLLTGAGLLGMSFKRILAVDPGFRPDHLVTAWVGLPWSNYKEGPIRAKFSDRWLQALRALPGVSSVGLGTSIPIAEDHGTISMVVEGHEPGAGEAARAHNMAVVSGSYFEALGIPLREGRVLGDADGQGAGKVGVIDEDFARRYWSGKSPIGYRVSTGGGKIDENAFRIVGVVGNVKRNGLSERDARGILYVPMTTQGAPFRMVAIVRSTLPPSILVPEMRAALLGIDPMLPIDDVKMMDSRIEESLVFPRSLMLTAVLFAAMALLLSAVGVYGVMAYTVVQRQREIGIRMALGALPSQILSLFLRRGGGLLLTGLILGTLASIAAGRLMESLLFNVSPNSPVVYAAAILALTVVVMLSTMLPSRRAAAVSVMESLRRE